MKIVKYQKHQKGKEYLKHLKPKVVYITVGTLLTALIATVATVSILNSMNTKKVEAATATPAWQQEFGTTVTPAASDHSVDYGYWGTVNITPGTAPTSVLNTSRPANNAAVTSTTQVKNNPSYYIHGSVATEPYSVGYQNSIGNNTGGATGSTGTAGTGATMLTAQNLITSTNTAQIVVAYSTSITGSLTVQNSSATGLGYYPATDAGFKQALYDIYTANQSGYHYVIYFGSNLTISAGATDEYTISSPSATDMNLYTLKGRAASMVFTSDPADPVGYDNASQDTNAKTVTFGAVVALGVPTAWRDITYYLNNSNYVSGIYAEGNAVCYDEGSWNTSSYFSYFGGSTGAVNISGGTNMFFLSSGNQQFSIYGGNDGRNITTTHTNSSSATSDTTRVDGAGGTNSSSTISGSTHVTIYATSASATYNVVSGGNYDGGTIQGNTNLQILGSSGATFQMIFGGGLGRYDADTRNFTQGNFNGSQTVVNSAPVTVMGSVNTDITGSNSAMTLQGYVGGAYSGNVATNAAASVFNNFNYIGGFSSGSWGGQYIIGGSIFGNVGSSSALANAIFNNINLDPAGNTTTPTNVGSPYVCGGNGGFTTSTGYSSGAIYGNIVNSINGGFYKTGTTTYMGTALYSVMGGNGVGSYDLPSWTSGTTGTADDTIQNTYVNNNPTKSSAVFGNIYTWVEGGDIESGGPGNLTAPHGGSLTGYVKGNSTLEMGRVYGTAGQINVPAATQPTGAATASVGGYGMALGSNSYGGNIGGTGRAGTSGLIGETGYYLNNPTGSTGTVGAVPTGADDVNMEYCGGGGNWGNGGHSNTYFQAGNTTTVSNNVVAGYTYGGNYVGEIWGNSENVNNLGDLNTFEGSSWEGSKNFGNSNAIMNGGSVGWFASGGAWDTQEITGDSYVQIYGGSFPYAYVGGTYGLATTDVIDGNSKVSIYGGDFGLSKSLCGAAYNSATIKGNSMLSLNLSGPNGSSFVAPTGIDMSGGSMTGTSLQVGTAGNYNTIGLKIILPATASTALNTALASDYYFIDGSNGSTTQATTLNSYIGTAGTGATGTIGSVIAENYTGLTGNTVKHTSNITIGDGVTVAGTIDGLGYSGTTSSTTPSGTIDSLTNYYFASSQTATNLNNYNVLNGTTSTGVNIYLGDNQTTNPVTVTGTIANYSSLTMDTNNNTTITGQVLNGANATAANHYFYDASTNTSDYNNSYSNFGTVTQNTGSLLTVNNTTMAMSLGKLIALGTATISTPFITTPGVINLSYMDLTQGVESWLPTTSPGSVNNPYNGYYWGSSSLTSPVFTFTGGEYIRSGYTYSSWQPSDCAPNMITPSTLYALGGGDFYLSDFSENETAGGQTTSTLSNYYAGYFTPGQRVEYTAKNPGGAAASGTWSYTMTGTSTGSMTTGTFTPGLSPGTGANGVNGSMSVWSNTNTAGGSTDLMFEYPAANWKSVPTVKVVFTTSNSDNISTAVEDSVNDVNGTLTFSGIHDYAPTASYASAAYTSSQSGAVQTLSSNPSGDLTTVNSGANEQLNASVDLPGSANPMSGVITPNTGSWLVTNVTTAPPTISASDAMMAQSSVVSELFNSSGVLNQQALENLMLVSGTGLTGNLSVNTSALTTELYNGGAGPYLASNQAYLKIPVTWTNGTTTKTNYLYILNSNAAISGNDALVSARSTTISYAQAAAVTYDTSSTDTAVDDAGMAAIESYMNVVALQLNTTTGNMSVISSGITMTGQNYATDVAGSIAGTATNGYYPDVTTTGSPKVTVGSNALTNVSEIAGTSATSANITGSNNGGAVGTTAVAVPATSAFLQAVNYAGTEATGTYTFGSSTDVTKGIYFSYTATDGTTLTTQHTTTTPVTLTVAGTAAPVLQFTAQPASVGFSSARLDKATNIAGAFSSTNPTNSSTVNDQYGNPATYLGVQDTLNNGTTPWEVQVAETTALTNTTNSSLTLEGYLYVNTLGTTTGTNADISQDTLTGAGSYPLTIAGGAQTVFYNNSPISNNSGTENANFGTFTSTTQPTPQINWANPFTIKLPAGVGSPGTYNGTVTWTLTDTP